MNGIECFRSGDRWPEEIEEGHRDRSSNMYGDAFYILLGGEMKIQVIKAGDYMTMTRGFVAPCEVIGHAHAHAHAKTRTDFHPTPFALSPFRPFALHACRAV